MSATTAPLSLTVERAALAGALKGALRAVESRSTIPILGNCLLRAGGGTLKITGTNLDQEVTAFLPAEIASAGAATVQAEALSKIVERLPNSQTQVTLSSEPDGRVKVTAGRFKFHLPTLPADTFPTFSAGSGENSQSFEIAGSIFANVLSRQKFAISTEETRYYLNGTYMHVVENPLGEGLVLRTVSTDGHRLARIDTPRASYLSTEMPGVIVPKATVGMIEAMGKDAGDALLAVEVSERTIRVTAGPVSLASKLIDGTFPDYPRVIPTDFPREAIAPTVELIRAVSAIGALARDDKRTRAVKCTFTNSAMEIALRNNSDGGEAHGELDIEMVGETPFSIGFNSSYLAEILAQIGSDTVRIRLGQTNGQALVVQDKTGEGLFVLMPMRI